MLSGLLVLCVLAAAPARPPAPPAAPAPFQWRVPGVVAQVDVPGQMNVAGMPIRLQVYTSREGIPALLQSFASASEAAGYYLQDRAPRLMRQPHLTALDTRTFTAYTLILEPAPGGQTTVILGEAKLGQTPAPASGDGLPPLYPGASHPLRGDFEGARTLAYQAPATVPVVSAWYREQLGRAGYTEEEPLLFRRRERQVRLSLRPEPGGSAVLLFVETAVPSLMPAPGP